MDTQNPSTAGAPTFKLAKVGKDRKQGGAAWFGGGSRGVGSGLRILGGGTGGGAGVGSHIVAAKILTIFLVSAVATFGSGRLASMLRDDAKPAAAADDKKLFASKDDGAPKYDDLSGVVKGENSIPNSLGYLSGSIDGLTPEERAKRAAAAEAARKAEEEAQKKADEEAAKKDAAMAAQAQPDPAALMAGLQNKDAKPGMKNFNKLSSSFGGGGSHLAGGVGLSGGVTRGFAAPTAKAQSGALSSYKGGARTSTARAGRATSLPSKSRGLAKRQLLNANRLSRQASGAGKADAAYEDASNAFNGGAPAGISIEGTGTSAAPASTNGTMAATDTGGPASGTTECPSGQHLDANGSCVATSNPNTGNASAYQNEIDLAYKLLMAATILSLLIWIYAKSPYTWGIASYLCWALGLLGGAIAAIGLKIAVMKDGDFMIGAMLAAAGGYVAYTAYESYATAGDETVLAEMAVQSMVSSALGMMMASSASKSSANQ